jgi:hypothetical protein
MGQSVHAFLISAKFFYIGDGVDSLGDFQTFTAPQEQEACSSPFPTVSASAAPQAPTTIMMAATGYAQA